MVDIDYDSSDKDNPDFFVTYTYDENSSTEQSNWYLIPLFEDYLNGWVRFVDIEN